MAKIKLTRITQDNNDLNENDSLHKILLIQWEHIKISDKVLVQKYGDCENGFKNL